MVLLRWTDHRERMPTMRTSHSASRPFESLRHMPGGLSRPDAHGALTAELRGSLAGGSRRGGTVNPPGAELGRRADPT